VCRGDNRYSPRRERVWVRQCDKNSRLNEEELIDLIEHESFGKLGGDVRFKMLTEGFRYGQRGQTTSDAIANVATKLLKAVVPDAATQSLRAELTKQFNEIPVEMIAEFFQKPNNMQELINIAKNF
jgi:hypothetical protein